MQGMECCAWERQGLPCLNPTYRRAQHPGRSPKMELRCQSRACHPAKHHGRMRQTEELRCQNPADHLRQTEEPRCQNPASLPVATWSGTTMSRTTMSRTKMKIWGGSEQPLRPKHLRHPRDSARHPRDSAQHPRDSARHPRDSAARPNMEWLMNSLHCCGMCYCNWMLYGWLSHILQDSSVVCLGPLYFDFVCFTAWKNKDDHFSHSRGKFGNVRTTFRPPLTPGDRPAHFE